MRPVSKKRQKLIREVKPIRDSLREEVGHCELCDTTRGTLDVHEIGRGVYREACLGERCALLLVCRTCHDEKLSHVAEWTEARQLAVLARSRPFDFNLTRFLEITTPRAPKRIEIHEVMEWFEEAYLTKSEVAERLQVDRRSVQNYITSGELPAIDCRTVGASKPLYRIAWSEFLEFVHARRVSDK